MAFVFGDGIAEDELDRVHHECLRSQSGHHGELLLSTGIVMNESDDVPVDRCFMKSIKVGNAVGWDVAASADLDLLPLKRLGTNRAYDSQKEQANGDGKGTEATRNHS